jgi:ribosome biogenesis protein Nip4
MTLVESRSYEAPVVKEELHGEGDADHCFVYVLAKHRGGRYSDGSCLELSFS